MYVECRGDYLCPGIDRVRMVWREGSGREGCVLWPGPKEHSRSARGDERSIIRFIQEEEEEEEGLFKADAVNEEDPERERATRA